MSKGKHAVHAALLGRATEGGDQLGICVPKVDLGPELPIPAGYRSPLLIGDCGAAPPIVSRQRCLHSHSK